MKRILAGLLALALLATPSFAQGPPSPPPVSVLAGQVSLSVSNVSARVAIPSAAVSARALTVYNSGANDAYIATGTIAVVATSGGTCAAGPSGPSCRVPAGSSISFYTGDAYLAAITAASTTTLVIYQGTGPVALRIYGAPNGAAPTGPAGGDLAGTYPNPTVTQASNGFAIPSGALTFSGNITGAAIFGTNGIKVKTTSGTLSDTTSTGTVAANYNNLFGGNTQTATSATTITNNHGSYFTAPICSTNVTCTANWALGADSLFDAGKLGLASGSIVAWNADTGLSRDSVLGALNLDLGNGSANDKSGTLNAAKVALGGATIGTDALGITGTMTISGLGTFNSGLLAPQINIGSTGTGNVAVSSTGAYGWTASASSTAAYDLLLTRAGAASLRLGAADAAAPVAQTLGVQNVVAGTSNTAGVVTTIRNSAGTGTALGGNTIFQYAPHDVTHAVTTFTGSASPYTIGFTAGNITTYPIGTVMTVSGCTTATLNGTYTVTASSSGSVTATTSATGTGSPTTCLIVGNTSQNAFATALTINGDTAFVTFAGNMQTGQFIQMQGTSSSFPALKRNTVNLEARLADDSAQTAMLAATFQTLAAGTFNWAGRSVVLSPADGTVELTNNAQTGFTSLQLGGTTASFPEIKRSTTAINFRLADDSADAPITAAAITNSGSLIAGGSAPTPTGTCTRGTQNGGNTTGSIVLTCTAQTLILTFATTAPTGYMCEAIDQTTTADTMKQTSNTTTSCTLTGTTAASDVVLFQARAY